jgi:hypothetical protein
MARSAPNIDFSGEATATLPLLVHKKRSISMERVPSSEPLSSDDSWGLLLVPILACIGLLVSAFVWL